MAQFTLTIPDETIAHYNAAYGHVVSSGVEDDPLNPRPTPEEFFVNNVLSQIEAIASRHALDEFAATQTAQLAESLRTSAPQREAYEKRLSDAAVARAERDKPVVEPTQPAAPDTPDTPRPSPR